MGYTFTDSSNLNWRAHLGWSLAHAFAHIFSALVCVLFLELMAEFVVNEGFVVSQNMDGSTNRLASSIYDEYTTHFSHTLEDFQLLNTTNSTFQNPPDASPACRFDESLYELVLNTVGWLQHEAPLLKTVLAVFD